MINTPFGDMNYGDDRAIRTWLSNHDIRHRMELRVIGSKGVALPYSSLDHKIDSEWFGRHLLYHMGMRKFTVPDDSVSAQLLEMEWTTEQNFYAWHQMHNDLHSTLDEQLGMSNAV